MSDVDLRASRVQLVHLKNGRDEDWVPLAKPCRKALEAWFAIRAPVHTEQRDYVFPSAHPGDCYPCRGSGRITRKPRKKPAVEGPCHHCEGSGKRWGISRHEVRHIVESVFSAAGIPKNLRFPHVLRHTAVTHMLDSGAAPPAIQERVGHKALATTFGYMQSTEKMRKLVDQAFVDEEDP